ncbi:hypothetical protein DM01DRAFT_1362401 [Hesseltinella vesiculosa]|uniref:Uncharacterized protein n=1 Tax=Hesseltinella vesiculosa TaxID=101127 RepID=A0A1X2GMK4_9FUNG|nr:hypothetical protein DM01DRAFT_1362401 [Hesseltinella vesiculosa]
MRFRCMSTTLAAPLQDVSVTSVELAEAPIDNHGDEHLFVTVTRVDDLVDDDGSVLAERIMAVRVTFDVEENQLRCNGVPVDIGVSNIEVQVQMANDPAKLSVDSAEELAVLQDSFDVGLASVEVTATLMDEMVTEEGIAFRRIAVEEKITEINHEKVVQTQAGQQILDIFENGSLNKWTVDPLTGFLLPEQQRIQPAQDQAPVTHQDQQDQPALFNGDFLASSNGSSCADLFAPVVEWWNDQSNFVRGAITGAMCAVFFGIALFVRHLIISANAAYEALPTMDQVLYQKDDEEHLAPPAYEHDFDGADEKQPMLH